MIEFIEAQADVIALTVEGKLEGAELETVMDRLEPMLEAGGKVHVFVETRSISGIAIDGLADYMKRAVPLLGKLSRFGRVAVVADQGWIRLATQIESAILPGISYRTYTPDQRDVALAWVKGEA